MKSLSEWQGEEGRKDNVHCQTSLFLQVFKSCFQTEEATIFVWLLISTSLEIVQESHDDIMQSDAN